MSNKQTGKIVGKAAAYILILLVVAGIIGLIFRFTNGFTSEFKTFYLTVDGKDILTSANGYRLIPHQPLKVEVKYTFGSAGGEASGYTVKVAPHVIKGKDFDFTLNGEVYSFQAESDLTAGFDFEYGEDWFTITPKGGLIDVLRALYPASELMTENAEYEDMYELIVTSYNKKASVSLYFIVTETVIDVSLDPQEILF